MEFRDHPLAGNGKVGRELRGGADYGVGVAPNIQKQRICCLDLLLGQLRQHLGVVLHRENARAILKRSRVLATGGSEALDAAVALQSEVPPTG